MSVIKPHLLAMSAYLPPLENRDPERHTLLDFNERTIPVSRPIIDALQRYIASGRLQQYPAYGDINQRLADYAGVVPEQLMITNGSDQGIDLVFRAVSKPGAEAIIPGPSFAMYHQCAKIENMRMIEPEYTREGGYPLAEVLAAVTDNTAVIVASNPNNPCGTPIAVEDIATLAKAAPQAAILVDECYFEYSQTTAVSLLATYANLFITRTFSKTWGIPSLRFGYLMASPENIAALLNIRGPYDINQLAVVAAQAALNNPGYTAAYVQEVMQQAKPMLEAWLDEQGIDYWPSVANYLWVFPENPQQLNEYLIAEHFLVRPKAHGHRLGLRITVGTLAQTEQLIAVWSQWLAR